jgi:hypothetical protein
MNWSNTIITTNAIVIRVHGNVTIISFIFFHGIHNLSGIFIFSVIENIHEPLNVVVAIFSFLILDILMILVVRVKKLIIIIILVNKTIMVFTIVLGLSRRALYILIEISQHTLL